MSGVISSKFRAFVLLMFPVSSSFYTESVSLMTCSTSFFGRSESLMSNFCFRASLCISWSVGVTKKSKIFLIALLVMSLGSKSCFAVFAIRLRTY